MTSYLFFKMVAQFYFQFLFSWARSFGKVEICLPTKFWRDISIHSQDISSSGFGKQTSAMWELYFRFWFLRLRHHQHVILHLPTKFRPDWTIHHRALTSYPFSRWQPSAILNFLKVTADHTQSATEGLMSVLKFQRDRMYSFGLKLLLLCWLDCCEVLAWNCLFTSELGFCRQKPVSARHVV